MDTGMNSGDSIAAFEAALAQLGIAPTRIRKIICTHHHPDHFGTSKAYKALTGATLYLHPAEYERAAQPRADRPSEVVQFFLAHGLPLARFAHVPRPHDIWGSLYVTRAARPAARRRRRARHRPPPRRNRLDARARARPACSTSRPSRR
ncbi:MAG: MBL fold metallo-hydrolase [Candidatus Binatia bacterium]